MRPSTTDEYYAARVKIKQLIGENRLTDEEVLTAKVFIQEGNLGVTASPGETVVVRDVLLESLVKKEREINLRKEAERREEALRAEAIARGQGAQQTLWSPFVEQPVRRPVVTPTEEEVITAQYLQGHGKMLDAASPSYRGTDTQRQADMTSSKNQRMTAIAWAKRKGNSERALFWENELQADELLHSAMALRRQRESVATQKEADRLKDNARDSARNAITLYQMLLSSPEISAQDKARIESSLNRVVPLSEGAGFIRRACWG